MVKITKNMQAKHKENLSPWLLGFIQDAASAPLPLIPQKLDRFPTRWPFPRGDLYHWIALLNRFDDILEAFCATYQLSAGPQMRDFGCELLLSEDPVRSKSDEAWNMARLATLCYKQDGDCQLIVAVLKFTRMLLEHCGNRSIYASSAHLNDLLNTTYLNVLHATLEVGLQLAQRYQASVKRMASPSRQFSSALLANHYNIDLDRIHHLSQPFVRTPILRSPDALSATPSVSGGKGKEVATVSSPKTVASMFANDLVAIGTCDRADEDRWTGWADVKILYYPTANEAIANGTGIWGGADRPNSSSPVTPTPLRRSTTMTSQQTCKSSRQTTANDSPSQHSPAGHREDVPSGPKSLEIPQATVLSSSIYELLARCPPDMPKNSRYEFLNRLRVCKALVASPETRQQALAVRLVAINNMAYIHPEPTFIEKALRQDNDEPRRYQLVYQLAELIHPSADGSTDIPLWLQSISLSLLEGISCFQSKYPDILSALNANVNHGVLLYVIRKAVASMKHDAEDLTDERMSIADEWRKHLFSLTLHMAVSSRIGQEMISAGLMDILVEILNLRSVVACRNHSMVLAFLDSLIYGYQGAFASFASASGLDSIANLIIFTEADSRDLMNAGLGTKPEFQSSIVDYRIPYHRQQTLKWLLKFTHHVMSNSFSYGGNTDRLLRNLVDNSKLLSSLRAIVEDKNVFGSVVWTNATTLLSDFINNDPTSFAAISESGLVKCFLESLTGRPVTAEQSMEERHAESDQDQEHNSPIRSDNSVFFVEPDDRPHPPTREMLESPRDRAPAASILPTTEALSIIPTVLNSISLNNMGMKMVMTSRALESYLEIFESPEHIRCMDIDGEVPNLIGSSFDELARHHPALRPAISNAILDMVAKVVHLTRQKSITDGWGAKLLVTGPQGITMIADENLAGLAGPMVPTTKGKGKEAASSTDPDIDMADATVHVVDIGSAPSAASGVPKADVTPYITALAVFLNGISSNSDLKATFVRNGGIELIFDLLETPSLPHNFCELSPSRMIVQMVASLMESAPILAQPSLLNRIQANIDVVAPHLDQETSYLFFAPFLITDLKVTNDSGGWDPSVARKLSNGTPVVKSLLNLQVLIKVLCSSFPYSSRQAITTLPAVNVFDKYTKLISSLGPLLRAVLAQEMGITTIVPQHWVKSQSEALPKMTESDARVCLDDEAGGEKSPKKPSDDEQMTVQYQNFKVLRLLLHPFMPSTFPFFQSVGKVLLQRRDRDRNDDYVRYHHLALAEVLAETILAQLQPWEPGLTIRNLHHWIIMLHAVHEVLVDKGRASERSTGISVIIPVLLAFMDRGGFDALNGLLDQFQAQICKQPADPEDPNKAKLSEIALKKILDIYASLANGKTILDCVAQTAFRNERRPDFATQLVVELRASFLPVVRKIWDSQLMERCSSDVAQRVVDILKSIALSDSEPSVNGAPLTSVFKGRKVEQFRWGTNPELAKKLQASCNDEDLCREAIYRSYGKPDDAAEYCRAHQKGIAGARNPVPDEDAFVEEPSQQSKSQAETPPSMLEPGTDPMPLDHVTNINDLVDAVLNNNLGSMETTHDESNATSHEACGEESARPPDSNQVPDAISSVTGAEATAVQRQNAPMESSTGHTKQYLDKERNAWYQCLIDRSLDVIRVHPSLVFEVSELVQNTMGHGPHPNERRAEVAETLSNALMSFDVTDEASRKTNGKAIAAYAHLLSLLLQEKTFHKYAAKTLRESVGDYMSFLSLPPSNSSEELPPWIPFVLLIFEILLTDDAQPVDVRWKPPATEDDAIEEAVWSEKEVHLNEDQRTSLLGVIIDILPRVGKEESLAVSVLRILVIITRDHAATKAVGERKNLQRLFVMAKQLCGAGSTRLRQNRISDNIIIILRHIIEDEETIRQTMQSEICFYLDNLQKHQHVRHNDLATLLRNLSAVALRSPKLFVEVASDMLKLSRWTPPHTEPRQYFVVLKDKSISPSSITAPAQPRPSEPIPETAEDPSMGDIKPSTESADKNMVEAPKTPAQELKRPVLENPDGVVHFLLCELLNYREVDDKEIGQQPPKHHSSENGFGSSSTSEPPAESSGSPATSSKEKDKKAAKPQFRADDHPIFVYRCFLLGCLAELLQSFNRAKVEFINFKRSAPVQTHTPVKPRSSVLIYLINDLLCLGPVTGSLDSITLKKKAATSTLAQSVLVSLVSKTGEKPADRNRDLFEYDDEPDLLFVRWFVLDTILRAYKDASVSDQVEVRYSKMLCLAELMSQMIGEKDKEAIATRGGSDGPVTRSHHQLKRLMYEKGYLTALTASIAEIDLTFPNVKRTVKYILRVLRTLSKTAILLSLSNVISTSADLPDDEVASTSSLSDMDDDREETPDLYRNSALGLLEPGVDDDSSEESDDDDDMYDEEPFEDELEYQDEMSEDGEQPVSEDDEELGEMGEMEGLPANSGVVEVIMGEDDNGEDEDEDMDEDDEDEDGEEDGDEDDEVGSDDLEAVEEQIEIVDGDGNTLDDDGASGWESDTDDEEGDEDEEMEYEGEAQNLHEAAQMQAAQMAIDSEQLGHFGNIMRAAMEGDGLDRDEFDDGYIDIDDGPDEEEDEEEMDEEDYYFDPGLSRDDHPPPNMPAGLGWDTLVVEPANRLRLRSAAMRSPFPGPFMIGGPRDQLVGGEYRHYGHRTTRPSQNSADSVMNPLLRRDNNQGREPSPHRDPANVGLVRIGVSSLLAGNMNNSPINFFSDIMRSLPLEEPRGLTFHFGGRQVREVSMSMPATNGHHSRETRAEDRPTPVQEPHQAVAFTPLSTFTRWCEEAQMLFGPNSPDKVNRLLNALLAQLAPAAIKIEKEKRAREAEEKRKRDEERKRFEEEERKAKEAQEAEEKAAQEKKGAEERAARDAAEAPEAAASSALSGEHVDEAGATHDDATSDSVAMEGVEASATGAGDASTEAGAPRIVTTIRGGESVDVTDLGIDPEYLAALPEEFREEVIAQTVSSRRSQAREQAVAEGENTEVFQEFLDALPDELRVEILQQEQQERRRRLRDEERRQHAAAGTVPTGPSDMDAASILLTFPPELRSQVLMEQGAEIMDQLPQHLADEARAMVQRQPPLRAAPPPFGSTRAALRQAPTSGNADAKVQRRTVVQMLDKAGIATLLRLMFVAQQGSIRNYLFEVFAHVCENKQNRLEIISNLLQILQEGSIDMDAVERSFGQLSLKAKQPRDKDPKTPSSLRRAATNVAAGSLVTANSEISPLLVVQQCLDLLVDLCTKIPSITSLFLTEHEVVASTLKRSLSRKGKAKDPSFKANKYAINSLLNLLDRPLVMESSSVMQLLADLLNKVTYPLQTIERRRKEAEEEAKRAATEAATATDRANAAEAVPSDDVAGQAAGALAEATRESRPMQVDTPGQAEKPSVPEPKTEGKKVQPLMPPTIPEQNLKLVINIFVARECSSKTFQNTIATIKNLSNIPNAKRFFGEELIRQARALSANIVADLDNLLPHILKAESGTEIQGVALSKFSPGASEQNKLLRVLTALDHLFDRKNKRADNDAVYAEDNKEKIKEDLLGCLYWNPTFGTMWDKLGACLNAIRKRDNMLNVATILLPLIESLMVVCKNTTFHDTTAGQGIVAKDMLLSSPPPENRMAGLFFSFTEEHRRILNELVRHNPKLMSGTFSLLVKNPKVLEFDNKRNYFNRSVHSKSSHQQARPSFPPLQLSVRRELVFHDSFRSLYFKSGDEMKFGKLSIRFHGEEGVDAGGVTREWFQVLARQMFDPNYALFIPVSSDRTTFHPNKLSAVNDEHLMFFKFIGRIIGKALYESRLLDCYFSRAVYKRILGKPVSVKDMESFDPEYYKSLVWMLENDITDIITETFAVEDDEFGVTKVVDLIENGRSIVVTEENKHEYVRQIVEHKLLSSVQDQMEKFLQGFHEIIPVDLIAIFNEQELELLISGLPDIDVDDWKSNTEYQNYTAASPQIQWFWRAVRSFDKEERAKLLQFVTGTSKVPLNGFKELEGMNGVNRFNIHRDYGNKERLPSSHTCFNQLDLPEYENYESLRTQLLKAITAGSDYFGFA